MQTRLATTIASPSPDSCQHKETGQPAFTKQFAKHTAIITNYYYYFFFFFLTWNYPPSMSFNRWPVTQHLFFSALPCRVDQTKPFLNLLTKQWIDYSHQASDCFSRWIRLFLQFLSVFCLFNWFLGWDWHSSGFFFLFSFFFHFDTTLFYTPYTLFGEPTSDPFLQYRYLSWGFFWFFFPPWLYNYFITRLLEVAWFRQPGYFGALNTSFIGAGVVCWRHAWTLQILQ